MGEEIYLVHNMDSYDFTKELSYTLDRLTPLGRVEIQYCMRDDEYNAFVFLYKGEAQ